MNGYKIESNIVRREGRIFNVIIVYKNDVIVSTASEDITAVIEEELLNRAL